MPSPVGHTLGAYAALLALEPHILDTRRRNNIALGAAFVFGSMADADFIVAHFTTAPYLHHHYFSHSIPFALLVTIVCCIVLKAMRFRDALKTGLMLGAAYGTHLLLDYFAEDGSYPYGIPLLWPFTDRHFIAPLNLFYSIHRGQWSDLLSMHNFVGIAIEIGVVAPVVLLFYLIARRRIQQRKV